MSSGRKTGGPSGSVRDPAVPEFRDAATLGRVFLSCELILSFVFSF
jgi:hypothetical protein